MKYQRGFTIVELFAFILTLILSIGWVWNIVKIAGSDFSSVSGILILRCIGIFVAPLGGVLGYL
jgi:hypothetical protein